MEEQPKEKKSYKMPVILVVVWVFIIILFGYSLWSDKANDNSDELLTETTIEPAGEDMAISESLANMTNEQREQALTRDSKRLTDMKMLRTVLEYYKSDNDHYPGSFDDLVPDYTEFIPQNPGPGGKPYVYTGIGTEPYSYYDISYVLEVGLEGIDPGMHIASPSGLATP